MKQTLDKLSNINQQIKELKSQKEDLERVLIINLHHEKEGQKTYNIDEYNLTIKTTTNFSLDKEAYHELVLADKEKAESMPVIVTISHKVDKERLLKMSGERLKLASSMITIKPAKPYVVLSKSS